MTDPTNNPNPDPGQQPGQPGDYQQPGPPQGEPGAYQQPAPAQGDPGAYQAPAPDYPQAPAPDYPQAPAPGYPQQGGYPQGGEQPGPLMDRFLARLIDHVLLAIVSSVIVFAVIVTLIFGGGAGGFGTGGSNFGADLVGSLLSVALYLAYFGYLESSRGQTLGKMVMKLHTRGPDGGNPTMEQALKRNAFVALSLLGVLPIVGWFLGPLAQLGAMIFIAVTINADTVKRQGWHDQFAGGTTVVKTG